MHRDRLVTSSSFNLGLVILRRVRGALALFVLTMFLMGGVLHKPCDLHVTDAWGGAVNSLADKSIGHSEKGHSEKGVVADDHCDGCSSVSVPARAIGTTDVIATSKVVPTLDVGHRGLPPGIDPPPPKFLT